MPDPLMRSGSVEISDIFFELSMELTFIQNEDMIQTLAANTAEKSFTNGIGFGSVDRRPQHFDAAGSAQIPRGTCCHCRGSKTEGGCRKGWLRGAVEQPKHPWGSA